MKLLFAIQLILVAEIIYLVYFSQSKIDDQEEKSPYAEFLRPDVDLNDTNTEEDYAIGEYLGDPDDWANYEQQDKNKSLLNEKGLSDGEIVWIYNTSRTDITLCPEKNLSRIMLCNLGIEGYCERIHISEALANWWIICPIYSANLKQTALLYRLHKNFRDYIRSYGISFQTVEVIFPGQKNFTLTRPNNQPYDLQYQSEWIFAMRENLVNVGIKHLPEDWEYMAWVDQHILWLDPYWFEKTIWLYSHYNIVHMLESSDFWSTENTTEFHLEGFAKIYSQVGMDFEKTDSRQSGLAWGMRREVFEELGGLLDICIGLKCDLYQNYAYIGSTYTLQANGDDYIEMLLAWEKHAIQVYNKSLGYLDSKVVHFKHCLEGCQTSDYQHHIAILMHYHYNPKTNLYRDEESRLHLVNNTALAQNLWHLYGGKPRAL